MNQEYQSPTVSVLIVNYNSGAYATKCIESLQHQQDVTLEVIIVDNASQDDSLQRLNALKTQSLNLATFTIIASADNLGFGRANNLAATHATSEYMLILNPDTELNDPHLIRNLIRHIQMNPILGLVAPRIVEPTKKKQVLARYHYPSQAMLTHTKTLQQLPGKIAWVLGACMLTTRAIYQTIHGFDEDYFLYGEDVDICLRVRQAGYEIGFFEQQSLHHVGGASEIGAPSYEKWLRKRRGMCLFIKKHYHPADVHLIAKRMLRKTQWYLRLHQFKNLFRAQKTHRQEDYYYRLTATLTAFRELISP